MSIKTFILVEYEFLEASYIVISLEKPHFGRHTIGCFKEVTNKESLKCAVKQYSK